MEAAKTEHYAGKIDSVHAFTPAIHNEHGRAGPQATEMLRRLATTLATRPGGHGAYTDQPLEAVIHMYLQRFRAIVSIHSAHSMAREVVRGALVNVGGDG